MANCKNLITRIVILELSGEEAKYLKDVLRNSSTQEEPPKEAELREAIYFALPD